MGLEVLKNDEFKYLFFRHESFPVCEKIDLVESKLSEIDLSFQIPVTYYFVELGIIFLKSLLIT